MNQIQPGDCRETMARWVKEGVKVQTCITSPPYWGLRDYGADGQLGHERDLDAYIGSMVEVFRLVREMLLEDGALWLQMGDCYRDKQLVGQPWRLAFAMQDDGWVLRRDICWFKPNAMPETVNDRPATAHEYIFLMTKKSRYFYDSEAIKEPTTGNAHSRGDGVNKKIKVPAGWETMVGSHGHFHREGRGAPEYRPRQNDSFSAAVSEIVETRNKRSVWTIPTQPMSEAHFATFPEALIEPCVLATSRPSDIVLDPFMGSGTTAVVASRMGRQYLGCELNPDYVEIAERRLSHQTMALPLEHANP